MREAERPASERLSVLDRTASPPDADFNEPLLYSVLQKIASGSVRLGVRSELGCVYLAPDDEHEGAFHVLFTRSTGGGGRSSHPRQVLRERGASFVSTWDGHSGAIVCGATSDDVLGVAVDGIEATLGENAYLVEVPADPRVITITRPSGRQDHELPRRPSGLYLEGYVAARRSDRAGGSRHVPVVRAQLFLMADYLEPPDLPLWLSSAEGKGLGPVSEGDLEVLVSSQLLARIQAWFNGWDPGWINPEWPRWKMPPGFSPEEMAAAWEAEGAAIRDALQGELGEDFEVIFDDKYE